MSGSWATGCAISACRSSGTPSWSASRQQSDGVAAELKRPDGSSETMRAAWVGGCDGARSSVRELSGITFPGAPYEHVFFVADVEMTGTMVADELNVYLWRDGFHLLFPMRGKDHWRIVGILPAGLRNAGRCSIRGRAAVVSR